MGSYRILIKPSAAKELEVVPRRDRLRIVEKIRGLASDPRPLGCEKLSGEEKYRIRQGDYRVLYSIQDDAERSRAMGDKGGKKGKDKNQKQKVVRHQQDAKKKQDKQKKSAL